MSRAAAPAVKSFAHARPLLTKMQYVSSIFGYRMSGRLVAAALRHDSLLCRAGHSTTSFLCTSLPQRVPSTALQCLLEL